jgi:hypothetical protein
VSADDRMAVDTPDLRLAFRWTGDRWTHALEVAAGPSAVVLARALEGDAGRDDPGRVVSPAYQQIHWQGDDDGVRAMLLGQSGAHHFSAVFSVSPSSEGVAVAVDVADRCRAEVLALAATYEVFLAPGDLLQADPAGLVWGREEWPRGRLSFKAAEPTRAGMAEAGRRAVRVQAEAPIAADRHTHRVLYRWHWSPRNGDTR